MRTRTDGRSNVFSYCEDKRGRGSLVKIRGLTRTQNFAIRTSLVFAAEMHALQSSIGACSILIPTADSAAGSRPLYLLTARTKFGVGAAGCQADVT